MELITSLVAPALAIVGDLLAVLDAVRSVVGNRVSPIRAGVLPIAAVVGSRVLSVTPIILSIGTVFGTRSLSRLLSRSVAWPLSRLLTRTLSSTGSGRQLARAGSLLQEITGGAAGTGARSGTRSRRTTTLPDIKEVLQLSLRGTLSGGRSLPSRRTLAS